MPSPQTIAADRIITSCERALKASCCSRPDIMMNNILSHAQELVNEDGYTWDNALAIASKIYPATKYAALYAYEKR